METKTCPHCGTTYKANTKIELAEHFGWRKKGVTLSSYCKQCRKEMNRQRYLDKKDEILAKNNEYYHNNKEKFKEYYSKNKDKCVERQTTWNKKNRFKRAVYNKAYYDKNREELLAKIKLKKMA